MCQTKIIVIENHSKWKPQTYGVYLKTCGFTILFGTVFFVFCENVIKIVIEVYDKNVFVCVCVFVFCHKNQT